MTMIMALALGALQSSDAEAEEAFRRIEARLRRSKTLSVVYGSQVGTPVIHRMKGSLHMDRDGRLNWDCRLSSPRASMEWPILAVSDGARIQLKLPTVQRIGPDAPEEVRRGRLRMEREAPADFRARMLRLLLVFGLSGPALPRRDEQFSPGERGGLMWQSSPFDLPWSRVDARDLRGPVRDDEGEVLTFKAKVEGLEPLYQVKLVYDPGTSRLIRRELFLLPLPSLVLTERYERWELDVDIPQEKFAPLPDED